MNTNKKTYIAPTIKEYEMGALNIFAGSAAQQKAMARKQIAEGNIWSESN